jgi:glycerol kinase
MKLFNMASEVGQHAIDRGYAKDTFGNMWFSPVTVGSKKEKEGIHAYTRN